MNTNDLNTALYEKMAAEQDKYRDWLKSQPPEEILHHTYEYTVREDIVMAMEDLELTDAQAQALLDSPTPLADVYRHFEKLETGSMGRWHNITALIRQTLTVKRPLNTPSAPTMRITGWIRSLRLRRCWKSLGRNEYNSSLPTPSSIRTTTVEFPVITKPGQRPFLCRRTAALRAIVLIWLWMGSILD